MKKYLIIALATCTVAPVYAAPKADSTKAEFTAEQQTRFEKHGWTYNQAKVDEIFTGIDTDGNGVASGVEKKAYWAKESQRKTPAKVAAKKTPTRKLANGESTLETYVAFQKKRWSDNGWRWNVDKVTAEFNAIDTDDDGIATGIEKQAYWAAWKANKSK